METQHLEDDVFEIYLQTGAAPQARLFQKNKKQATLGTHTARTLTGLPLRKTEEFKFKRKPFASVVAQMVKNPLAMQKTQVQSLHWEDPLEKGMATHSSILVWIIQWTKEPWQATIHRGCKLSDGTGRLTHTHTAWGLTSRNRKSSQCAEVFTKRWIFLPHSRRNYRGLQPHRPPCYSSNAPGILQPIHWLFLLECSSPG